MTAPRLSLVKRQVTQCPIPTLKPGTTEVATICSKPTDEVFCDECWARVTPVTRREFNMERNRMRRCGIAQPTPRMRELIKRVIIEAAVRP